MSKNTKNKKPVPKSGTSSNKKRLPSKTSGKNKPVASKPKPAQNVSKVQSVQGKKAVNVSVPVKSSKKKENYPHFRRYRKSGHPALIVGEQTSEKQKEEYKYRKVMHGEKDGRHANEKVSPNPNPKDKEPMYIAKRVRHDEKKHFEKRLPWKYPKK